MFKSCKRPLDYSLRVTKNNSTVVHACLGQGKYPTSFPTACGLYLHKSEGYYDVRKFTTILPPQVTCKSCLKVLAKEDTNITVNEGNLFVVVSKDGLFVDKSTGGDLTSNILNARLYKSKDSAEKAITEEVYVNKQNKEDIKDYRTFWHKIMDHRVRQDYYSAMRLKPGFKVMPVTLSYKEEEKCDDYSYIENNI